MEQEILSEKQKGIIKLIQGNNVEVMHAINAFAIGAAKTEKVLYIDSANSFNPEIIMMKEPQNSNIILDNLKIARPFTAFQFITLMDSLETEIQRIGASVVVITGINTLFLGLKRREIRNIVPGILQKIKDLKKEHKTNFLIGNINSDNPLNSSNELLIRQILRNHLRKILIV